MTESGIFRSPASRSTAGFHLRGYRGMQVCLGLVLIAFITGCPPPADQPDPGSGSPPPGSGSVNDGNFATDPVAHPGRRIQGEPNNSFELAIETLFDANNRGRLQGTISPGDVDVYSLGAMNAGDRIVVDVADLSGTLDPAIAIFDAAGEIAFQNDDRDFSIGLLNPFLNDVIRHSSGLYFLAIAASPGAPPDQVAGVYDANVTRVLGGAAPAPQPQTVVLNFRGGSITIPRDTTYTLGPFDTADIAPEYDGMTVTVRNQIAATVRQDFTGLALTVRVSPPAAVPSDCSASVVFFGGRNPRAFGTSQGVDFYNRNQCDQSILFTEMFTPTIFGRVLTAEELGIAIGTIASHEIGHLLGLSHVANVNDLMDTTGGPNTFFNQEFGTSPLHASIFPIGAQDGVQLLLDTLGGLANQ